VRECASVFGAHSQTGYLQRRTGLMATYQRGSMCVCLLYWVSSVLYCVCMWCVCMFGSYAFVCCFRVLSQAGCVHRAWDVYIECGMFTSSVGDQVYYSHCVSHIIVHHTSLSLCITHHFVSLECRELIKTSSAHLFSYSFSSTLFHMHHGQ